MFPNLTAFFDWIEANVINGFAAKIFDFFKNFALGWANIQPFIDAIVSFFSFFSAK